MSFLAKRSSAAIEPPQSFNNSSSSWNYSHYTILSLQDLNL